MAMLFVENPSLDPWFNIAAEEYLLKHLEVEVVMLWRSRPSVIVGKHQNTLAEINLPFVQKNQIPVIRRLSGGGTVFHDPGNLNFTFIKKVEGNRLIDFELHTKPLVAFLNQLGVNARFEGKNDLRVNGLKISGNAEHIHKNKVLHHGTLLFDADLTKLNQAIKAKEENFQSKAVKSARSQVVNISDLLPRKLSREQFTTLLKDYLQQYFNQPQVYSFEASDIRAIEKIKQEKYTRWHWNFAYSPVYTYRNRGTINGRQMITELEVSKGVIREARVMFNGISLVEKSPLIQGLKDLDHNPDAIAALLRSLNFEGFVKKPDPWELLDLFF